jgi:hypothetical protein
LGGIQIVFEPCEGLKRSGLRQVWLDLARLQALGIGGF